jgi:hypothetical protein
MSIVKAISASIILHLVVSCSKPTETNNNPGSLTVDTSTQTSTLSVTKAESSKEPSLVLKMKKGEIIRPKFPVEELFGIWTTDSDGPHADFRLDSSSFYIVDYDGDGDMPYLLIEDSLTIFFNDYISKNKILKADKDSFILESEYGVARHVRWKDNYKTRQ